MGCGMSTEEKEGKQRNEEIENQLKRDKLSQRNEIKMLLLGRQYGIPSLCNGLRQNRCGRVWKVDNSETDEAHPRGQLLDRRTGIIQGNHLQQHGPVNARHT